MGWDTCTWTAVRLTCSFLFNLKKKIYAKKLEYHQAGGCSWLSEKMWPINKHSYPPLLSTPPSFTLLCPPHLTGAASRLVLNQPCKSLTGFLLLLDLSASGSSSNVFSYWMPGQNMCYVHLNSLYGSLRWAAVGSCHYYDHIHKCCWLWSAFKDITWLMFNYSSCHDEPFF